MPKKTFFFLFILFTIVSCSRNNAIKLANNGQSQYHIIISKEAFSLEIRAADTLSKYLNLVTGAKFPVITDEQKSSEFEILIGNTSRKASKKYQKEAEKLPEDAFLIKTEGKKHENLPYQASGGKSAFVDFL